MPLLNEICAPAEVSRELCTGAAPNSVKLAPGSNRNVAVTDGSEYQSCAQAARPNSESVLSLSRM